MNRIRRLAAILAGLAGALLAVAAVAPAALADPFPPRPPGWDKHPQLPPPGAGIHVVVVGGMPGWQIALIAIGAALLAATAAAGIIAKRGGRPVGRPRAKMSALGTASGSARNIPSHRTVTSRSANPASYAPTAPAPPTSGPRHRGRTPGPGQTDHPCPHAFPAGDLTGGQQRDRPARDCAGSPRSVLPQPAGPVLHAGPASAVPGHLRLGVHRHHHGRGRGGRHLALLRPRHHHAGDHQRRIRQSRSAYWTPTSTHLR
jgi:hypothetical protein